MPRRNRNVPSTRFGTSATNLQHLVSKPARQAAPEPRQPRLCAICQEPMPPKWHHPEHAQCFNERKSHA